MSLNEAQELFAFFFAIYFALIIDRAHQAYNPWDTYNAYLGKSHNIKRLVTGWVILLVLPLFQFAILFTFLGIFNVTFDNTVIGVINITLISISAFFSFGYFRIYEAFIHHSPEIFFSDEERSGVVKEIRPKFSAHFIPGVLYIIVSTLLLAAALYL